MSASDISERGLETLSVSDYSGDEEYVGKGGAAMDVACSQCGRLSPSEHIFCGYCGASLKPDKVVNKMDVPSDVEVTEEQQVKIPLQPKRRVSGLGCGVLGGLVIGGGLLLTEASRTGFVSLDAAVRFVFNVCFYGCIAAAIGFGIERKWKQVGYSLLVLVLFLVLWFALSIGLLAIPG